MTVVIDEREIREVELRATFAAATRLGEAESCEAAALALRAEYGYRGLDLAQIARDGDRRAAVSEKCPLGEREMDVLQLAAQGLNDSEIAARLHLAPSTIKTYLGRCYKKLGVHDRTAAVVRALSHGWMSTEQYLGETYKR